MEPSFELQDTMIPEAAGTSESAALLFLQHLGHFSASQTLHVSGGQCPSADSVGAIYCWSWHLEPRSW